MTFQKSYIKSAMSNENKKPHIPQIKIENPLKTDIYVNAINLVADIYFSLKGRCEVVINGDPKFMPKDNAFRLRKEVLIPLENQILQKGKSIEIYIWNTNEDTDLVELSVQILLSENIGNITLSGQAVDDSTMLQGISGGAGDKADTHDIFPYQIYTGETNKFLINTKGRQNMLLTMASSNVLPPIVISNSFTPDTLGSYLLQLSKNQSSLPNTVSGTTNENYRDYISHVTLRNCVGINSNDYFRQTRIVTDYLYDFEKITLQDGTELVNAILGNFTDYYILIDVLNKINKQIKFV